MPVVFEFMEEKYVIISLFKILMGQISENSSFLYYIYLTFPYK